MRGSKIGMLLFCTAALIACASEPAEEQDVDSAEGGESALGSGGVCAKRDEDCSYTRKCCTGSVCAFGGERDGTWCQALEPLAWKDSCVQARKGAKVQMSASTRGRVCLTLTEETMPATCYEVKNGYCLIGFRGECGDGEYFIHTSMLVQTEPENCP